MGHMNSFFFIVLHKFVNINLELLIFNSIKQLFLLHSIILLVIVKAFLIFKILFFVLNMMDIYKQLNILKNSKKYY
jgi:hypothetical protein